MDAQSVPTVSVEEARQLVKDGARLVDVREDDEWQAGHAPEATHIPLGLLGHSLDRLPRDSPIVAVCKSGGRSQRATQGLRQYGFDVTNLVGGMDAWSKAGFPVVTDAGTPGTVL